MKNNKFYLILIILTVSSCGTRDNTELLQFNQQLTLLSEETSLVIGSVTVLSDINRAESIAEHNPEQLESIILQRNGTYSLTGDTTARHYALLNSFSTLEKSTNALLYYSLLLAELTDESDITIEISDILQPFLGDFAAAFAVLFYQGSIEKSSTATQTIMQGADSSVEDVSSNIAMSLHSTANSVQATYSLMAARRQRSIITEGYPIELIEELLELNNTTVEILARLELLNRAWSLVPDIHRELASSISDNSISATVKILGSMLLDLREEEEF